LEGRISKLPLDKENKLKEGSWRLAKGGRSILCLGKEKEECVRRGLVHMCEKCCSWKRCVQTKNMEGSYVSQILVVEFMEGFV